jgi:hypothetical protein
MNLNQPNKPVISRNMADFTVPGVVIEVDPIEAETWGAFEENALNEQDAIDSEIDAELDMEAAQ